MHLAFGHKVRIIAPIMTISKKLPFFESPNMKDLLPLRDPLSRGGIMLLTRIEEVKLLPSK